MGEEKTEQPKYDYCMVLPAKDSQLDAKRQDIVERIVRAGFITRTYYSIQKDEVLVLIGCGMRKLEAFADLIDYKMLLDETTLEEHAKRGDPETGIPPIEIGHQPDVTKRTPYQFIYGKVCDTSNKASHVCCCCSAVFTSVAVCLAYFCSTTRNLRCRTCTGARRAWIIRSEISCA